MIEKQWLLLPEHEKIEELQLSLNISPLTAKILVNRGIKTVEEGKRFLYADLNDLYSPWDLPDMKVAVARIIQALNSNESITIYGDYDVDGQTGTAILVKVLRRLAAAPDKIYYYIPHRIDEGYGLNQAALTEIASYSSLVITVDCGISAIAEAAYAKELSLDLIITDHHEPGEQLPEAVAVINPKRKDSQYPFTELAGVGVAYKLAQALGEHYQQDFSEYLDLVALGTVADLVPLVDENRIITKFGLRQMSSPSCIGVQALIDVCKLKEPYQASDLAYRLGPRLNAVGRIGDPARGLRLLLTDDSIEAESLAMTLDAENTERQTIEQRICQEAEELIEAKGWQEQAAIVVANEHWHPGVIGIVASRLVEKYYRPTIVIALEDGVGKASARSISEFNLFEGLSACSDLLETYGGHEMAAGLQVKAENIPLLRERLIKLVEERLDPNDFIPKLYLDGQASLPQLDAKLLQEFSLLEPFGIKNPSPLIQVSGAVQDVRAIGDGSHVSCQIRDASGEKRRAVGFGMYDRFQDLQGHFEQLNFAVSLQPGFRDSNVVELLVRDLQAIEIEEDFVSRTMRSYPWQLAPKYRELTLLKSDLEIQKLPDNPLASELVVQDGRHIWDKMDYLFQELDPEQSALIYVATAEQALMLCRRLRITIPKGANFIGFDHEYLTEQEKMDIKQLLANGKLRWLVSTGINDWSLKWQQMVYYYVPITEHLLLQLVNRINSNGKLIALYNKSDVNWYQSQIRRLYPDRNLLARFYLEIIKLQQATIFDEQLTHIANQLSMETGLEFALGVFAELNLIERFEAGIKLQPKPAEKLDLYSSVLYNEGMKRCEQYFTYSQHCLERGFFNELNGKDTDYRRFSQTRH
ncbi:MAG: single-stranded-DNA-specific exonuclease RecJ [Firmicutes bacterium]|nr:single-stranded-DNA-specific exonuclease RecJ [Bacillota bacterium]